MEQNGPDSSLMGHSSSILSFPVLSLIQSSLKLHSTSSCMPFFLFIHQSLLHHCFDFFFSLLFTLPPSLFITLPACTMSSLVCEETSSSLTWTSVTQPVSQLSLCQSTSWSAPQLIFSNNSVTCVGDHLTTCPLVTDIFFFLFFLHHLCLQSCFTFASSCKAAFFISQ